MGQRPRGLTEAGLNHAQSKTKVSAPCVGAKQDDFVKGICSPGRLGPNLGSKQLYSAASILHSHQIEMSSLTF